MRHANEEKNMAETNELEIKLYQLFKEDNWSDERASEAVNAVKSLQRDATKDLATKVDLADTRAALKVDLADTKAALITDLADTKAALITDLADTKAALKTDLADTKAALKTDLSNLKTDMVTRMYIASSVVTVIQILGTLGGLFGILKFMQVL